MLLLSVLYRESLSRDVCKKYGDLLTRSEEKGMITLEAVWKLILII